MKHALTMGLAFLLCTFASGQDGSKAGNTTERQIVKLEQDWAHAIVKTGAAAVDQYEADDITTTDVSGRVTDKTQDKKDLSSGDMKVESWDATDIKVHIYGNTAVANGIGRVKGTMKGEDMSGTYRFTDTWVKRNGKWQCVASQGTKIQAR